MNVQIRAKRILSRLASYRSIDDVGSECQSLREQALLKGAYPIGIYMNSQGDRQEAILISDLGIFVSSGSDILFVEYKRVERVDVVAGNTLVEEDSGEKSEADGLLISMLDTSPKLVPVRNGNGKYRDVFEFSRFMNRAVNDAMTKSIQVI
jgi:hypothetical protein